MKNERIRINEEIRAKELRVVGADGANLGVISLSEALKAATDAGLDLIEISPKAKPPVAKVMDYGKFQYEQKKKDSAMRAKSKPTETKSVQVKMGTGEHDKMLKAKRAAEWLSEGHRVKVELFLKGRYKYMDQALLRGKLEDFLKVIPHAFKIADPIRKVPKGFATVIERDNQKKNHEDK
ncbi:MAG: translation initiation factor IF-3 [Patescibacteria group bacterium UBA2103]